MRLPILLVVPALLVACQSRVVVSVVDEGGGAGGALPEVACDGAIPVLAAGGYDSGFVLCPDGTVNRIRQAICDTTVTGPACAGDEQVKHCLTDADCAQKPHGACLHEDLGPSFAGSGTGCSCVYPCETDADCKWGQACICRGLAAAIGEYSMCAETHGCTTNTDCPTGQCALSVYADHCGSQMDLACRSSADTCATDADCGYDESCSYGGSWLCGGESICYG